MTMTSIVRWLLWLMLAFAALPALAQSYMTTVTAQVKDANGTLYNSCRYSATLVNLSNSTLTLGGTSLPDQFKQVTGTQCDASGNLSTKLVANTALIPNNSQWRFTICDSNGANCFNFQTTISGTTIDITALIQSAAVILPITNTSLLAGNNNYTGINIFNNFKCKGNGCFDVTSYGADPTGVADSSAAFQAAITAAGNGAEIYMPPGTYTVCNVPVNQGVRILGSGNVGWSSVTTPTTLQCGLAGGVIFHVINAAGNTTILHTGPEFAYFTMKDSSNAGAGGLMNGGILIESTLRGTIRNVGCGNFTNTTALMGYCENFSQPASALYDQSYWTIEQPFVRNSSYGIQLNGYSDGTIITGGEIVANVAGIYAPHTAIVDMDAYVYGTSIEVPTNAVGAIIGSERMHLAARFEGSTGATGNTCVQLLSTAKNNSLIGSSYAKCDTQVDIQAGASNNDIDITQTAGATNAFFNDPAPYNGNRIKASIGTWQSNSENGNLPAYWGMIQSPSSAGFNQPVFMMGRYGMLARNAGEVYVGAGGFSRDGAGNLAITFPFPTSFTAANVGDSLIISGMASTNTFNSNNCVITVFTDSQHITCSQAGAVATGGFAFVYSTAGLNLSGPGDGLSGIVGHGLEQAANNGSTVAAARNASWTVYTAGSITMYCNTGLTVGSAFTRTQCFQITPTGSTVNGTLTVTGNQIIPSTAGGAQLGNSANPFSGVQIGTSSTNRSNVTTTATAARAVSLPDAGGTLMIAPAATTTGRAACIKGTGQIGYCSTQPDATGACTCN